MLKHEDMNPDNELGKIYVNIQWRIWTQVNEEDQLHVRNSSKREGFKECVVFKEHITYVMNEANHSCSWHTEQFTENWMCIEVKSHQHMFTYNCDFGGQRAYWALII